MAGHKAHQIEQGSESLKLMNLLRKEALTKMLYRKLRRVMNQD